jgi:hypothetical protein
MVSPDPPPDPQSWSSRRPRGGVPFGTYGFAFAGTNAYALGNRGILELDISQPRNVVLLGEAERTLQR